MSNIKKLIAVGAKRLSGQWEIIPVNFVLDAGDNFRVIYGPFKYDGASFAIDKLSRNGRVFYKEVSA